MPYPSVNDLPPEVKEKYTSKQQRAFKKAFNSAVEKGKSEEQAFRIAHRAAQRAGKRNAVQNTQGSDNAREFSTKQRKKLANKGQAMSDGSFPIANKQDLRNAIQAYGRASNKAAAKRHIIKRAKALGATDLLPDSWKSSDSAQEMTMITCSDCERQFFDQPSLDDHAEAVHTHNEVYEILNNAIESKFGRRSYIHDVADDWVVFVTWSDYSDDRKMLKVSYSMDDSGSVSFGDPSEVRRKISYVPTSDDSASAEGEDDEAAQVGSKTAVHGTPATDLPHGFTQDEGSHPFFCSDCGRSRPHPLHNPPSAEGGGA